MKTAHVFGITLIFITLIFAFASANFDRSKVTTHNLSAASLSMQIVQPTPSAQDASEVGSTDGIVIMGVIIIIIVTVPVLFRRKRKERK
jgi:ABC-type sugar transport system permease subunit